MVIMSLSYLQKTGDRTQINQYVGPNLSVFLVANPTWLDIAPRTMDGVLDLRLADSSRTEEHR